MGRRKAWSTNFNAAIDNRDANAMIWACLEKSRDDLLLRVDMKRKDKEQVIDEDEYFTKEDMKFYVKCLVDLSRGKPIEGRDVSKKSFEAMHTFLSKAKKKT